MRGVDESQDSLFSYGCLEERIPAGHPLRAIRKMADEALRAMDRDFAMLYSPIGRSSIAPEQQLRALLVMVLYSIRSERRLMEELRYNLLYRWFVELGVDEAVWDVTVCTKNRERFIDGEIARKFFYETVDQARVQGVISAEHFTVDGTLIEAWASQKSFRPKDEPNPCVLMWAGHHASPPAKTRFDFAAASAAAMRSASARMVRSPSSFRR